MLSWLFLRKFFTSSAYVVIINYFMAHVSLFTGSVFTLSVVITLWELSRAFYDFIRRCILLVSITQDYMYLIYQLYNYFTQKYNYLRVIELFLYLKVKIARGRVRTKRLMNSAINGCTSSPKFPIPRGCFPEDKWSDSQRIKCPVSGNVLWESEIWISTQLLVTYILLRNEN